MSHRVGYTVAFLLCLALTAGAAEPAREELLAQGEKALEQGDAQQAARLFEQAGFVKHAADAEIGLTRAYMQAGEYRRALSFAAHTAGAHPDSRAGGALYAQLLDLGGQTQIAARLLERAGGALPGETTRFVPFSPGSASLPPDARIASSGVLIGEGRLAVSPAAALRDAGRLWVRNGLGALVPASVLRRVDDLDLAILELARPLAGGALEAAARDPFPGSAAFAVDYASSGDATPAWPALRVGFLGKPSPDTTYALGIALPPGPRGGPVLDAAGRLVGIALADAGGRDRLLPASLLKAQLGPALAESAATPAPAAERAALDEIYERALATTLQVIVAR